jgi:hypothetical protein
MLAACGHPGQPPDAPEVEVPARATTAGDAALARLPDGADLVVELDLKHLRDNAAVGELAKKLLADPQAGVVLSTDAPLARADVVVIAVYGVGKTDSKTLMQFEVDGAWQPAIDSATPRVLANDRAFMALRAQPMPPKATDAVVRVTARLDFDARVAVAARLGLDSVPASAAIWGDVADDLAVVADLDQPNEGPGTDLPTVVGGWRDALAVRAEVTALGLGDNVAATRIVPHGTAVHVVATIGPRRLEAAVARAKLLMEMP